ncbi:unnamed protein product, partial [Discosporangium mesarthrocarpum]
MAAGIGVLATLVLALALRAVKPLHRAAPGLWDSGGGRNHGPIVRPRGWGREAGWREGGAGLAIGLVLALGEPDGNRFDFVLACTAVGSCLGSTWNSLLHLAILREHDEKTLQPDGRQASITSRGAASSKGDSNSSSNRRGRDSVVTRITGVGFLAPLILGALYCGGLFSNSFIEGEDTLHQFLAVSAALALAGTVAAATLRGGTRSASQVTHGVPGAPGAPEASSAVLWAVLAAAFLRLAAAFPVSPMAGAQMAAATTGVGGDEEEPGGTDPGYEDLVRSNTLSLAALPALWLICAHSRGFHRATGFRGRRVGVAMEWLHRGLQALCLAAVGAYWLVQSGFDPGNDKGRGGGGASFGAGSGVPALLPLRLLLPRLVYLCSALGLVLAVASAVRPGMLGSVVLAGAGRNGHTPPRSLSDYASASAASVATHLATLCTLLLGPTSPPSVLLLLAAGGAVCECVRVVSGAATSYCTARGGAPG